MPGDWELLQSEQMFGWYLQIVYSHSTGHSSISATMDKLVHQKFEWGCNKHENEIACIQQFLNLFF